MTCDLEKLSGIVVIIGDGAQQIAKAVAAVARVIAAITIDAATSCAVREKERELYRQLQAEIDARDPLAELLQAADGMATQDLLAAMEELAELALDMPPYFRQKTPRPPKCLGPVNKANHTASRPPRRARSSCYKRHR